MLGENNYYKALEYGTLVTGGYALGKSVYDIVGSKIASKNIVINPSVADDVVPPGTVNGLTNTGNSGYSRLFDIENADDLIEGGTKTDVLAQNRANGRAYEQQEFAKFSSQNNNAVEQITIKTSSGVKTRVDAIGLDSNGKVVINEYKSSLTAPLTDNQKIAFPEIYESGGIVVGKGKGIFSNGYQISPGTKVAIIRPE